jgi:hypothetical protein
MKTLERSIPWSLALDGARILASHRLSRAAPSEFWVREFSKDEAHVRISRSQDPAQPGNWFRTYDLRVDEILEPGKAPPLKAEAPKAADDRREPPDVKSYT